MVRRLLPFAALLLVTPAAAQASGNFPNPTPIAIPAQGATSSSVVVAAQPGVVADASVVLHGVTHARPVELDLMLVAPNGAAAMLMSDTCGALGGALLAFSDTAPHFLPGGSGSCTLGLYRPANFNGSPDVFPADAPPSANPRLADVAGHAPNGRWKLYVADQTAGTAGAIADGWTLSLVTREPDARVPGTGTSGPASVYPLTREVAGLEGVIADVDVTLDGVSHRRPQDLEIRLVGPQGQAATLMSDVCTGGDAAKQRWTWDSEAPAPMPQAGPCEDGRYRPDSFEADPDLPQYPARLQEFNGTDPNGTWKLYVDDDADGEAGSLLERFTLKITTRDRARVFFEEPTPALEVAEGETLTVRVRKNSLGRGSFPAGVVLTATPLDPASGDELGPARQPLRFAAGEQTKEIRFAVPADARVEGPERFRLSLSDPEGDARIAPDADSPASLDVTVLDRTPLPVAPPGVELPAAPQGAVFSVADRTAPVVRVLRAKGRNVSYRLSEPAKVTVVVERRVGRRWKRATRVVRRVTKAGAHSVRLGKRRRGRHRVVVTAVDAAGNRSRPARRPLA